MRFYAERDTQPRKWYPRAADGNILKFDDLPQRYQSKSIRSRPSSAPGDPPAMSDADIRDIVAFLNTLTDRHTARKHSRGPDRRIPHHANGNSHDDSTAQ